MHTSAPRVVALTHASRFDAHSFRPEFALAPWPATVPTLAEVGTLDAPETMPAGALESCAFGCPNQQTFWREA
jgi:hypothetical protein